MTQPRPAALVQRCAELTAGRRGRSGLDRFIVLGCVDVDGKSELLIKATADLVPY